MVKVKTFKDILESTKEIKDSNSFLAFLIIKGLLIESLISLVDSKMSLNVFTLTIILMF
jgi:hypothetical protein